MIMLMRWVAGCLIFLLIIAIVGRASDHLLENRMMLAVQEFAPQEIVRGIQRDDWQVPMNRNEMSIEELRRRVENLESAQLDVKLAVMNAKIDTVFDLVRVLMGAAIVYVVQVVGTAIQWFGRRHQQNVRHRH